MRTPSTVAIARAVLCLTSFCPLVAAAQYATINDPPDPCLLRSHRPDCTVAACALPADLLARTITATPEGTSPKDVLVGHATAVCDLAEADDPAAALEALADLASNLDLYLGTGDLGATDAEAVLAGIGAAASQLGRLPTVVATGTWVGLAPDLQGGVR
jgi:hypothetical protein